MPKPKETNHTRKFGKEREGKLARWRDGGQREWKLRQERERIRRGNHKDVKKTGMNVKNKESKGLPEQTEDSGAKKNA